MSSDREDRVASERAFHDERFSGDSGRKTAAYYEVDSGNVAYRTLVAEISSPCRVLEYGCGLGSAAFGLASRGIDVVGIDISPVAIEEAWRQASEKGVDEHTQFVEMDAHRLLMPDESFDVVCGSGVLHHLELEAALPEVARVLKPDGRAIFYEPLGTNPVISLYRRLTPSSRTPDEHPLLPADLELASRWFGVVDAEPHSFVALLGVPAARIPGGRRMLPWLHRLDRWLFRRIPFTRRWAWVVVLDLRQPVREFRSA